MHFEEGGGYNYNQHIQASLIEVVFSFQGNKMISRSNNVVIRISICDDDEKERMKIEKNLISFMSTHSDYSISYSNYSSPIDMLESFHKKGSPDVVLLDICMPGYLGTDVAWDILRQSGETDIIFVTTSPDYALDAFSMHASDYIKKPYSQDRFDFALLRVLEKRREKTRVLITSNGMMHLIALEDIVYIETSNKKKIFVLSDGERYETWMKNDEIEKSILVIDSLEKCGSSYMINLSHIKAFKDATLIMDNGEQINVPRRVKTAVKERYFDYYMGKGRDA